jgi:hypothetical protein
MADFTADFTEDFDVEQEDEPAPNTPYKIPGTHHWEGAPHRPHRRSPA